MRISDWSSDVCSSDLRLNRLTDYAVVVMSQMAVRGGETRSAQQISDDTGVPLPTVAKLLNLLGRAKLVTSQRGASGGYVLSAAPDNITVAQIIQAIDRKSTRLNSSH